MSPCDAKTIKDPKEIPLDRHVLIEASAGTGKTYTIVELYLRLLLEKQIPVTEILVVTFTEKATGELKERIRERLLEKKAELEKGAGKKHAQEQSLIERALFDFASAPIHTIHGFCKSLLSEYAFETGERFASEMTNDKDLYRELLPGLIRSALQEWRQELRELFVSQGAQEEEAQRQADEFLIALLEKSGFTEGERYTDSTSPDSWTVWMQGIAAAAEKLSSHPNALLWPEATGVVEYLAKHSKGKLSPLFTTSEEQDPISKFSDVGLPNSKTKDTIEKLLFTLAQLPKSVDIEKRVATLCLLTEQIGEIKFSDSQSKKLQQKFPGLYSALVCYNDFTKVPKAILARRLQGAVEAYKEAEGYMSFNDMLRRVWRALPELEDGKAASGDSDSEKCKATKDDSDPERQKKKAFQKLVRERFRFAVVDEFQDTDTVQWGIFSRIFLADCTDPNKAGQENKEGPNNKVERPLVLVGDPKQAIYGFRGADIYAYFAAKRRFEELKNEGKAEILSLGTNYRSTEDLICALNTLFRDGDWFGSSVNTAGQNGQNGCTATIEYTNVKAAKTSGLLQGDLPIYRAPLNVIRCDDPNAGQQAQAGTKSDKLSIGAIRGRYFRFVASEITRLVQRLQIQKDKDEDQKDSSNSNNKKNKDKNFRPLRYGDIAILVQTRKEASNVQRYLKRAGIPHARYQERGLYQTPEAQELHLLLLAQRHPAKEKHLRAFLLTGLGRSLQQTGLLPPAAEGADLLSKLKELLQGWRDQARPGRWPRYFETVFRSTGLLSSEGGVGGWDSVRLLNFFQLREQLEEEAMRRRAGLDELIRIVAERKLSVADELSLLRTSPEDDRVQILTFHVAKGLEFPVVFIAGGFGENTKIKLHVFHESKSNRVSDPDEVSDSDGVSNSCMPVVDQTKKKDATDCRVVVDLTKKKDATRYNEEQRSEKERLLYVALTRPKALLYVPLQEKQGTLKTVFAKAWTKLTTPVTVSDDSKDSKKAKDSKKDKTSKDSEKAKDTKDGTTEKTTPRTSIPHASELTINAFGDVVSFLDKDGTQTAVAEDPPEETAAQMHHKKEEAAASEDASHGEPKFSYIRTGLDSLRERFSYIPIESFSSLARKVRAPIALELGEPELARERIDESEAASFEEQDLPEKTAASGQQKDLPADPLRSLGGFAFGSLLHEILEKIDYSSFRSSDAAGQKDARRLIAAKVRDFLNANSDLSLQGKQPREPDDLEEKIYELVRSVLSCPIPLPDPSDGPAFDSKAQGGPFSAPHEFRLSELSESDRLHEVEFFFEETELRDLLAAFGQEHGLASAYLNGSIDLVFRIGGRDGRYYLADWKSNTSPVGDAPDAYSKQALEGIMEQHNYAMQRQIYCRALHKWLSASLPGYDFERHFGGAYYFFLRGMKPAKDGSAPGVLFYRPSADEIGAA